jgi:ATP-dependent Lon protease
MVAVTRSSTKKEDKKKRITKERKEQKPPSHSNNDDVEPEVEPELSDNEKSSLDDIDEEEEDIFENDYSLPQNIKDNDVWNSKSEKIINSLKEDEPTLEKILNAKIRFKRQKELFEWFYIYRYSFPNTEDRILLKDDLNERLKRYKSEYKDYIKNKQEFLEMEKIEEQERDIFILKRKLFAIETTEENRKLLFQKYHELDSREYHDEEYYKLYYWFKKALELPYNKIVEIKTDDTTTLLQNIRSSLDKELYGMEKVKEQILLYVHNKLMFPSTQSQCLGLIGPPGVGKTSIVLCLSNILNIPFEQISLGGVTHADFIKGHDFTFVGSKPGQISTSMINLGCKNGILFFDEFEKVSENKDVVNSLLHITDTSQNKNFRDNFFGEISIDLSNIWFICSMNEKPIDKALSDRIFYIKIDGYTKKEKTEIVKSYLLPRSLKNLGLKEDSVSMSDTIISTIIEKIGSNEEGIRLLKQGIQSIISKIAFLINNQQNLKVSFSLPNSYYPLQYPVKVDNTMIDLLLKEFVKERNFSIDYLYV